MKNFKDFIVYLVYRFFNALLLNLPKNLTKSTLKTLAFLAYKLGKKRRNICMANLNLVFKDTKTKEEKENIIYQSYISLLYNMYEFLENQTISKEQILAKMKVCGEQKVLNALKSGRKMIFVSAHFGGWEISVPFVAHKYKPLVIVGKDMKNPFIQKSYKFSRKKNHIQMFSKHGSAKELIKGLKEDKAMAILIDQSIEKGLQMPFLGIDDLVIDSASRIGLKFDALIIPCFAKMNDFRDYTLQIGDIIDVKNLPDEQKNIEFITALQIKQIENIVFKYPTQYLWQHKRFKKYHEDIYPK